MTKALYSLLFTSLFTTVAALAQPTTSSPYSRFGLGDLTASGLPQNEAMGGISMGLRRLGNYSSVNVANPASYSSIGLTTYDMGLRANFRHLTTDEATNNNINISFRHIVFGVPLSKKSGLSVGLMPYSEMGYQYKNPSTMLSSSVDHIYSGDGGISKVYIGSAYQLVPNLSVGVNVAYLFGNLKQTKSTELPGDTKALNSREESNNSISGLSFDYGFQYVINRTAKSKITLGYAGSFSGKMSLEGLKKSSTYRKNFSSGDETISLSTPYSAESRSAQVTMPLQQSLGFAYEKNSKLLLGADVSYANWSRFRTGELDQGLSDSYTVVAGGQFTPNVNAVSGYYRLVDYRFGIKYNNTFMQFNNQRINQYAITFGLGLPLSANRLTFYKINFSAEIGRRGTTDFPLVRENYVNFGLGFTINDKWFIKPKFD